MDASGYPEIFFPLFGLTLVWLALFMYLLRYLRLRQPAEFDRLGRPDFQQGSYRLLGWLFLRRHRNLGDRTLTVLCDFMLLWFTAVQAVFLYLVYTIQTAPVGA